MDGFWKAKSHQTQGFGGKDVLQRLLILRTKGTVQGTCHPQDRTTHPVVGTAQGQSFSFPSLGAHLA